MTDQGYKASIPLDRVKAIADAAVAADLATPPTGTGDAYVYSPALRAKLADLGIQKPTELTGEQADAVEAFIASAT